MTTALVTGASRGIGEAVVRAFRARDYEVHALALDDDDLRRVAAETGARAARPRHPRSRGPRGGARRTSRSTSSSTTPASCRSSLPFAENEADAIDLLVDVNLRAALHVTRLVLPGMIARDRGHLFFLGSIAGRHPTPNTAVYAATKAALHAFAEGLRCDLLGTSIRVTVLMPGRVQTRLYDGIFGGTEQAAAALYDDFEAIQPADIAAVITTALDLPANVDLTAIEILPTGQVFGGSTIAQDRGGLPRTARAQPASHASNA